MRVLTPSKTLPAVNWNSIFLAGPTPRSAQVKSWRPKALEILNELDYDSDVCVPEPFIGDFDAQVSWELHCLKSVNVICFWVPRDLSTLPGFTTNVEFGMFLSSDKILYGRPDDAPKNRYLDWHYKKRFPGAEPYTELDFLIQGAAMLAELRWK